MNSSASHDVMFVRTLHSRQHPNTNSNAIITTAATVARGMASKKIPPKAVR